MYSLVASVTEHNLVSTVVAAADDTRFWRIGVNREQLVVLNDHGRIDLRLLHFILNRIAIYDWTTNNQAQLDLIECCSAYRATVRALNPWLKAGVVQVMLAWQKVGYDLVIRVDTAYEHSQHENTTSTHAGGLK